MKTTVAIRSVLCLYFGLVLYACQIPSEAIDTEDDMAQTIQQPAAIQSPSNTGNTGVNANVGIPQQQQKVYPANTPNQARNNNYLGDGHLRRRVPEDTIQPPAPPPARNRIQIALLLDTSSSMDGLIEQAKSQLWKMVNELAKASKEEQPPQVELSLYEYGNDWLSASTGYLRKVGRLTIDLEWISSRLFRLKTNGGSEYCAWAIKDAVETLDWSESANDYKVIFIAGNESFLQGSVPFEEACAAAMAKGIMINTIHCGDYETGVKDHWRDGAACHRGQFMNIDQSEEVAHIPTPYDEEVLEINDRLNDTYIGYGARGRSYKAMQAENDVAAGGYSAANTRTRAFYKSKANYKNENWDLVDATTDNDYEKIMENVEDEDLPEEMRDMPSEERKAYVEGKRAERAQLQARLVELEAKVDSYIAERRMENAGDDSKTLDNAMMSAIRKQAEEKGFLFD